MKRREEAARTAAQTAEARRAATDEARSDGAARRCGSADRDGSELRGELERSQLESTALREELQRQVTLARWSEKQASGAVAAAAKLAAEKTAEVEQMRRAAAAAASPPAATRSEHRSGGGAPSTDPPPSELPQAGRSPQPAPCAVEPGMTCVAYPELRRHADGGTTAAELAALGIDPASAERHLSEQEFAAVFEISYEQFKALKEWQRDRRRNSAGIDRWV